MRHPVGIVIGRQSGLNAEDRYGTDLFECRRDLLGPPNVPDHDVVGRRMQIGVQTNFCQEHQTISARKAECIERIAKPGLGRRNVEGAAHDVRRVALFSQDVR